MYCSNCGASSNDKVCKICGVKQNKTINFCKYCGEKLDPNCKTCPHCGEPTKVSFIFKFLNIIKYPIAVFFILLSIIASTGVSTLSAFGDATAYLITIILLPLFAVLLILVPTLITKKHNTNKKSRRTSQILAIVFIILSVVCCNIMTNENTKLNNLRDEAEFAAQLEKDFASFVDSIEDGQYEVALVFTELDDVGERLKMHPLYNDYWNYAKGMAALTDEPVSRLYDALVYLSNCSEGFKDSKTRIAEIKDLLSSYVGIYRSTDKAIPVYLSITENAEYAIVLEDDYNSGEVSYFNRVYREHIQDGEVDGWALLLTGQKLVDGEFELTYDYNLFATQNTTDMTLLGRNTISSIDTGIYEKISDTPLAAK